MLILAIDTALTAATAVVARGDVVLAAQTIPLARGHQEVIAVMAEQVTAEAGIAFRDLDRVGVTVGPGSFTGLRVGLAFAKGFALAWDTPLVGIGALEALAETIAAPGRTLAVIDAGRGQVYRQWFAGEALSEPGQLLLDDARAELAMLEKPDTIVGSGAGLLRDGAPAARIEPTPYPTGEALARLTQRAAPPTGAPLPLYLRAPDAKTLAERGVVR